MTTEQAIEYANKYLGQYKITHIATPEHTSNMRLDVAGRSYLIALKTAKKSIRAIKGDIEG